jgi:hypothetical protein
MGVGLAVGGAITLTVVGAPRCASYAVGISWATAYWQTGRVVDVGLGPFVSRLFWHAFGWKAGTGIELIRKIAVWIARGGALALTMLATPIGKHDRGSRPARVFLMGGGGDLSVADRMASLYGSSAYSFPQHGARRMRRKRGRGAALVGGG